MSDYLNRVDAINDTTSGTTTLAGYTYLGAGTVVRITYPEPGIWLDLWGGTSGTFNGLDQFNRVIDQLWQNNVTGTPTAIDEYQYGYDQSSNRLYKANVVGTAAVTAGLDEFYTYDPLNRLTEMQRGVLNSAKTGITGTPAREMDYTLDSVGNWSAYLTKTSGTTDLSQTRTANPVNEMTAISSTPSWATPPAYDAAGNMISFPQPANPSSTFTAVYNAWNRIVSISSGGSNVATYQYDGRGRRIIKFTASTTETRHFYYTNSWQDVEERVGTSTSMDKQYVWAIRYVDELICRDDATPQRLYACQDANFNLTAITDTTGGVQERYLFDPYGSRTIMDSSWAVISSTLYVWVIGFQGLALDGESGLVYDRARSTHSALGLATEREPNGHKYIDGPNLYQMYDSSPVNNVDPYGLQTAGPTTQPTTRPTTCPAPNPPCFAILLYRPVNNWKARLGRASHSFWWVQDSSGAQHILSGGPLPGAPPFKPTDSVLDAWVVNNTTTGVDNQFAALAWTSGRSPKNCAGVDAMVAAVRRWPFNAIPYDPTSGPNSNSTAAFLAIVGGFVPNEPPGDYGWNAGVDLGMLYYAALGY